MKARRQHDWPSDLETARALQEALRAEVRRDDGFGEIRRVAGVDVGFEDDGRVTRAAVVVLAFPELLPLEQKIARRTTTFPYVPGFLSFREVPAVLDALETLVNEPDVILCDGQGIAHPRRFGIASHLGVLLDHPTVGVAKSMLVGRHGPLPPHKGDWTPLVDGDETIGAVLRTRERVRPVYVSCGHRVSLASAVTLVMRCVTRYRLPEPTRLADRLASSR
ncbi:MAG TPA: deoxyribonuclease V [Gammaproteobacteria bacterium]|nr:deoxyribonuclease V [Gammaproteobacteria bacterium]